MIIYEFDFVGFLWGYLIGSDREQVPESSDLDKTIHYSAPGEDDE